MIKFWTPKNHDYALTLPLGLLCALFGSALLLESFIFQRSGSEGAEKTGTVGQDGSPGTVEPEAAFELPPLDNFSAFVDRPLFLEGRKPVVETEQSQAPAEEDKTPLALTLMGVMLSHRGDMAILAEASGKNRRVKVGGAISGWRLVELKPDRVTLQRGEERRDLPLMKPRAKGPAVAAGPGQPAVPGAVRPGSRRGDHRPVSQPEAEPPMELTEPETEDMDEPMDPADSEAEE